MKRLIKKVLPVGALLVIAIAMLIPSAFASNGVCTFSHGVGYRYTFGRTTSTAVEDSIGFIGYVVIYPGGAVPSGTYTAADTRDDVSDWSLIFNVGASAGRSFFGYYIGGVKVHQSSAWWEFDFKN
jgi:hypothetical protein